MRHHRFQIRIGQPPDRNLHSAEELGAQPAQPVQDFGRIRAEAEYLAQTLVEVAKGAISGGTTDEPFPKPGVEYAFCIDVTNAGQLPSGEFYVRFLFAALIVLLQDGICQAYKN